MTAPKGPAGRREDQVFRRSRRKIILAIMGSLLLLFVITLSVILFASYREIRQQNRNMLERYAELYFLDQDPSGGTLSVPALPPDAPEGAVPEPPDGKPPLDRRPDYQLSTFYSVAFGKDGTVLKADTGEKAVYSEEALVAIARKILDEGSASGRTGNLAYVVGHRPDYTLVALMDNTVSESGLRTLLRNVVIIGFFSIAGMFFVALYLSKKIIRPLEENDLRQKRFVSDASHELKTPIAVIAANAELLNREIGENEWLANIRYENERMGGLVRQLLDLSRAENTGVKMEPVDFSRVVTGEALVFETLAFENGKTLRTDIEEGVLLTGDPTQLGQIVSILLDNAIRHATGNEIRLDLKRQGHTALLQVLNDAPEIPPEKLTHLFDRFYRLDEARSDDGPHYGLGLSIAKVLTEKHGGSIGVSCRDGKIRFAVSLPQRE